MDRRLALSAILWLGVAPVVAAIAKDDEILVTGERTVEKKEPERVVDDGEICAEAPGPYRLEIISRGVSDDLRVRLRNLGNESIFVYLERKDDAYRADYPGVQLLFKRAERDAWREPLMSPGEFFPEGLERVSVRPGRSRTFSVSVSNYIPADARIVRLQLQFQARREGNSPAACIASAPFALLPSHR